MKHIKSSLLLIFAALALPAAAAAAPILVTIAETDQGQTTAWWPSQIDSAGYWADLFASQGVEVINPAKLSNAPRLSPTVYGQKPMSDKNAKTMASLFGTTDVLNGTVTWDCKPVDTRMNCRATANLSLLTGSKSSTPLTIDIQASGPDKATAQQYLAAAILFAANLRWTYIIIIAVFCIGLPFAAYNSPILKSYQKKRIDNFLQPESDRFGGGWNVIQAEIAVGTGGMTGKGYRNGTHTMLGYLPPKVADSDFIFPVIAEETGFAGTFSLILLYGLLLFSILRTALLSSDLLGRYLCVGIAAILMTHVFINIGMCIRLVPVTGLPLPFISYGGTFLVAMLCYLGIAQSVYAHRNDPSSLDLNN